MVWYGFYPNILLVVLSLWILPIGKTEIKPVNSLLTPETQPCFPAHLVNVNLVRPSVTEAVSQCPWTFLLSNRRKLYVHAAL